MVGGHYHHLRFTDVIVSCEGGFNQSHSEVIIDVPFTLFPDWNMEMSVEEFVQWMKEDTERLEADRKRRQREDKANEEANHQEHLKYMLEMEERNRKREADHNEYMERSHQEHLKNG